MLNAEEPLEQQRCVVLFHALFFSRVAETPPSRLPAVRLILPNRFYPATTSFTLCFFFVLHLDFMKAITNKPPSKQNHTTLSNQFRGCQQWLKTKWKQNGNIFSCCSGFKCIRILPHMKRREIVVLEHIYGLQGAVCNYYL